MLATWQQIRDEHNAGAGLFELAMKYKIFAPLIQSFCQKYTAYILTGENEPKPEEITFTINWDAVKTAFLSGVPKAHITLFYGPQRKAIDRFLKSQNIDPASIRQRDYSEAIHLYKTGLSLKQIEQKTGTPAASIRKYMVNNGYEMRKRGNPKIVEVAKQKRETRYQGLPWIIIEDRFGRGASVGDIAKQFGVDIETMSLYLKMRGIEVPDAIESLKTKLKVKMDKKYAEEYSMIDWQEVKEQYDSGYTWENLVEETGLPKYRIRQELEGRFDNFVPRTFAEAHYLRRKAVVRAQSVLSIAAGE